MNQASSRLSDKVTVLVFKDNYAARTFQVSLSWINRLGILLGVFLTLTLVSGFLAIKYYRINLLSAISRGSELDQITQTSLTIPTLTTTSESPMQKIASLVASPTAPNSSTLISALISSPMSTPISSPISNPIAFHTNPNSYQFSAFPDANLGIIPSADELPFAILTPKVTWEGRILRVRFALQYIKGDQDSQQGRIVILARSPESIRAYPNGILSLPGKNTLINPENGEFFSVSRFREVKADFGPVKAQEVISSIELFIFDAAGKILVYQTFTPPDPKKKLEESPIVPSERVTDES